VLTQNTLPSGNPADPGLHVYLPNAVPAAPAIHTARPKVAILREQGVNSHVEMAYTFTEAGFDAYDVHMTDLQTAGRVWRTSRVWWPAAASVTATLWARALAGRARITVQRGAVNISSRHSLARPGHLWPGRVQWLSDVCRTGAIIIPGAARLAALHDQLQ
jgi:hypothetical protein